MIRNCPKCEGTNLYKYDYIACIDCNEVFIPEGLFYEQRMKIIYSKEYLNSVPYCQECNYDKRRPVKIRRYGALWAICQVCSDRFDDMYAEETRRIKEKCRLEQEEEYRRIRNSQDEW